MPGASVVDIDASTVPECDHGQVSWCPNQDLRAANVTYDDCGLKPFVFCYCASIPDGQYATNLTEAVSLFGHVPAGARSFVDALSLMPDTDGHAFTEEQHIALFRNFSAVRRAPLAA